MQNQTPKYRIIYHEVGHALQYMDFPITPENVLRKAVMPLARTQVDCLSWLGHTYLGGPYDMPRLWRDYLDPGPYEYIDEHGNPMGLYSEKIRPHPDRYHDEGQRRRYGTSFELWKQGVDVVDLAAQAARRYGMDFFMAFRINDVHHGGWKEHPRWWLEHPEARMQQTPPEGMEPGSPVAHAGREWARLNFALPAVREHMMAPMIAAAECYDCDGIEVDFSRGVISCIPHEQITETTTLFLRELRARLDEVETRTGRRLRIMARSWPSQYALAVQHLGLDYKAWIAEGLVDYLLIGAGEDYYRMDLAEAVAAARGTKTRVYPAFDCLAFNYMSTHKYGRIEYMRAACLNYYHQGADGMYYFNGSGHWACVYPGPTATAYPHLREVGDPDCLERLDKTYVRNWCLGHEPTVVWSSETGEPAQGVTVDFRVSDDLEESRACGDLERVTLKVNLRLETPWINELNAWHAIWSRLDTMLYQWNGQTIRPEPIAADAVFSEAHTLYECDRNWTRTLSFDLTDGPLPCMGENEFFIRLVAPDTRLTGPRSIVLGVVELEVRYKQPVPMG